MEEVRAQEELQEPSVRKSNLLGFWQARGYDASGQRSIQKRVRRTRRNREDTEKSPSRTGANFYSLGYDFFLG